MRHCACSNPATRRKFGDWICDRCYTLDFGSAHKVGQTVGQIELPGLGKTDLDWEHYHGNGQPPICGGSLIALEAMLKAA